MQNLKDKKKIIIRNFLFFFKMNLKNLMIIKEIIKEIETIKNKRKGN